jgi:uncharacterized protein
VVGLVQRRIRPLVSELLAEEPVIALQGPRAVGKTTLLRDIAATHGVQVVDLDDLATRGAVVADPALFVSGTAPVCIDEYQHAPDLLDAIKTELNRDTRPGRFVITGSTRHDALPAAAQSLTGRLHRMTVYPLSQGEIAGVHERFLDALLEDASTLVTSTPSSTTRDDYIARIATGGFPMALGRSETARNRWFDNYVTLSLQRDVQELSRIRQKEALPKLLARLAGQTAQLLNIRAAPSRSVSHPTPVRTTPVCSRTSTSSTGYRPGARPCGRVPWPPPSCTWSTPASRAGCCASALPSLPDTTPRACSSSVICWRPSSCLEILKQASWLSGVAGTGHWRTHDGIEVDLVLELDDGRIIAIEVKAGTRVTGKDLNGLRALRDELGDAFVAGVALHTGQRSYSPEDRIYVMPVDSLWAPT